MDIRYMTISPGDARDFSSFMLPHVLRDEDYNKHFYHIAIRGESVAGMLVESGTVACPEILSIGVSYPFQRTGVASGLVEYAINEMRKRTSGTDRDIPNTVNVRLAAPTGKLDGLRHLFEKQGFMPYSEGSYYKVPVSMIAKNPMLSDIKKLQKVEAQLLDKTIIPLSDTPADLICRFNSKLAQDGSFPEIDTSILDKKLTFFGMKDGEIDSCILFEKQKGDEIYNLLLYHENDRVFSPKCIYLIIAAATTAVYYPGNTNIMFWIGNPDTADLMAKLFPDAQPVTDVVEMELPL